MAFPVFAVPVVVVVVLALVVGVPAILVRGKRLKCPECGEVFGAPAMDQKRLGGGWTFPFLGVVECPKCRGKRSRKAYAKA